MSGEFPFGSDADFTAATEDVSLQVPFLPFQLVKQGDRYFQTAGFTQVVTSIGTTITLMPDMYVRIQNQGDDTWVYEVVFAGLRGKPEVMWEQANTLWPDPQVQNNNHYDESQLIARAKQIWHSPLYDSRLRQS